MYTITDDKIITSIVLTIRTKAKIKLKVTFSMTVYNKRQLITKHNQLDKIGSLKDKVMYEFYH